MRGHFLFNRLDLVQSAIYLNPTNILHNTLRSAVGPIAILAIDIKDVLYKLELGVSVLLCNSKGMS